MRTFRNPLPLLLLALIACSDRDGRDAASGASQGSTYPGRAVEDPDPARAALLQQYQDAVAAVDAMPGDAALVANAGVCAMRLDELDLAREWLDQALAVDDRNLTAHQWMGVVLDRMGEVELAETHLQIAADMSLEQPLPFLLLARVQGHRNDANAAQQNLERALGKDDVDSGVLLLAAEVAREIGHDDAARTYLVEVLTTNLECDDRERSDEALVSAYLALGDLELDGGDPDGARSHWESLLEIDPGHAAARQRLDLLPR